MPGIREQDLQVLKGFSTIRQLLSRLPSSRSTGFQPVRTTAERSAVDLERGETEPQGECLPAGYGSKRSGHAENRGQESRDERPVRGRG